jgi:hypothetical protein
MTDKEREIVEEVKNIINSELEEMRKEQEE